MNRIRLPLRRLVEGERRLEGEAAHYAVRVLRLRRGDRFVAFDPTARVEAEAVMRSDDPPIVDVGAVAPARVVPERDVTWIHALPKGDKAEAIVADATELGATRILFASTSRSVRRIDDAKAAAVVARWDKIAVAAARQSGRGDAPEVALVAWDVALATPAATKVILHPSADPGPRAFLADDAPIAFAAGPEGGFTEGEIAAAVAAGFEVVSLGAIVLRTETTVAAVLGGMRLSSV